MMMRASGSLQSRRYRGLGRLALLLMVIALVPLAAPVAQESAEPAPAAANQYDGNAVIKKLDELMRGDSNYSEMKMTIYNPAWPGPRSYEMKGWEDTKNDKSFIRITSPARDRGKAFLKVNKVFKVYIPSERENKPMTIPPSLMLQPWMGSDFTNDDLVRQSSILDDYTQTVEGVETVALGKTLIRVRLDPRPDAAVVWGKIVYWVRAADYLPTRQVYYDEDGVAVREMLLSEVKTMGDRELPTRWEMVSLEEDKAGRRTVLELQKMEFNVELDDKTFTDKNLTRRDWD